MRCAYKGANFCCEPVVNLADRAQEGAVPELSHRAVRFGVFEVDLRSAELRKQGLRVRLQEQPFQVLAALLERPGEVVTREELIRRLWADGTVVDFDRGLNAAITRLRQALSDGADVPRYVETVARRGYRFIAPIETIDEKAHAASVPIPPPSTRPFKQPSGPMVLGALGIALSSALFAGWWWFAPSLANRAEPALHVVPLTAGGGQERNPSFSPDGSQVVYEWMPEDGARHLYVKVVGAGDPIALTSGSDSDHGPAWSPDGRLIAFLRELNESTVKIFVIPPVGGVERQVAEAASPDYLVLQRFHRRLDWTRDSRHVIVSVPEHIGGPERLLLVSVDSGEKRWLTNPFDGARYEDREPAVSPDGRTVAFARGELAVNEVIHLLPLSDGLLPAGPPRRVPSAGRGRSPAWTPDGKRILYSDLNPGTTFNSGIWVVGLDRRDTPRLLQALGRNAAIPTFSQTGRLAYSRLITESDLWRQEIPNHSGAISSPVRLSGSASLDFNPQYSPDGAKIAFSSDRYGRREIWTCASDGTHCDQVTRFNTEFVTGTPRWSPDGKQIVFDSSVGGNSHIYVVNATGGSPRRMTDSQTRGLLPSWSHDGKWIYFCSAATGRREVWKVPCSGGHAVQVTRNGGYIAFDSPDSRFLYYTKTEQNAKLFRSSVDGSGETEVLAGVANRAFVVTSDRIFYERENPNHSTDIRAFSLATGKDVRLLSIPAKLFLGLSVSPDGKYLAYSQFRVKSNLMLVDNFQ